MYPFNNIHLYHHSNNNFLSKFSEIMLELHLGLFLFFMAIIHNIKFLNKFIIIYFTIFYTMIHNVNYSIFHVNKIHECHHHNETTNIGPDIMDIVFGTKYDINDIENTDHYIFPIIIASIISYILKYNWEIINNKKTCLYLFSFLFSLISIIVFAISIYLFFKDYTKNIKLINPIIIIITTMLISLNNFYIKKFYNNFVMENVL